MLAYSKECVFRVLLRLWCAIARAQKYSKKRPFWGDFGTFWVLTRSSGKFLAHFEKFLAHFEKFLALLGKLWGAPWPILAALGAATSAPEAGFGSLAALLGKPWCLGFVVSRALRACAVCLGACAALSGRSRKLFRALLAGS